MAQNLSRNHFFNAKEFANKFTNFDTFHEHLISDKFKNEETPYLGYAVIKDLPDPRSAVGVMLLATYPSKSRDLDNALKLRHHPCTKKYEVNIFGKKLVIDSLVTQSQTGVSACASTALFSAIHLLSDIYTTDKLFPAQITKLAYRKYPNQQRAFPNRLGLDTIQVVGVLRELRLAHELVTFNPKSPTYKKPDNISSKDYFKALLYAYNECSIPVLVMIDRFDNRPTTNDEQGGLHLVVSAGYRIDYDRKSNSTQIKLFSDKIDKHFFMDDNRGAFTAVKPNEDAIWDLETLGKNEKLVFYDKIHTVIVPLERSVSVDYKTILAYTIIFNDFNFQGTLLDYEWQIKLQLSNSYKETLIDDTNRMALERRKEILLSNLPKYIWIAKLCKETVAISSEGTEIDTLVEFVYDATVLPESSNFCRFVNFNTKEIDTTNKISPTERIKKRINTIKADKILPDPEKQIAIENCCQILEREITNLASEIIS